MSLHVWAWNICFCWIEISQNIAPKGNVWSMHDSDSADKEDWLEQCVSRRRCAQRWRLANRKSGDKLMWNTINLPQIIWSDVRDLRATRDLTAHSHQNHQLHATHGPWGPDKIRLSAPALPELWYRRLMTRELTRNKMCYKLISSPSTRVIWFVRLQNLYDLNIK